MVMNFGQANELFLQAADGSYSRPLSGDAVSSLFENEQGDAMFRSSVSAVTGDFNGDGSPWDVIVLNNNWGEPNQLLIQTLRSPCTMKTGGAFNGDGYVSVDWSSACYPCPPYSTGADLSSLLPLGMTNSTVRRPDDSCPEVPHWAQDGYCDEPSGCSPGTDCTDCGNCAPPPPPPEPPTKCQFCPAGKVGTLGRTGSPQRGWKSRESWLACVSCSPGKYRDETQQTDVCTSCPTGRYAGAGFSECEVCAAGRVTNTNGVGADSCRTCPPGRGPDAGQTGAFSQTYGRILTFILHINDVPCCWTDCNECPSGMWSGSIGLCQACDPPRVPAIDKSSCGACPPAKGPSSTFTTCEDCEAGKYSSSGQCATCPPGSHTSSSQTRCDTCASFGDSFWYSPDGSACARCPAGQEPNAQRTGCVGCVGQYSPDGRECLDCAVGSEPTSEEGSSALTMCAQCAAGTVSDGTRCTPCPAGTQPDATQAQCESCMSLSDTFWVSRGSSACERCEPGQQPNPQRTTCLTCVEQYSPDGRECLDCAGGSVAAAASGSLALTTCVQCAPGTVSNGKRCTQCRGPAAVSNSDQTACDQVRSTSTFSLATHFLIQI